MTAMNKSAQRIWPLCLIFISFIVVADQFSKWAVTENILRPANYGMNFFQWLMEAPEQLPDSFAKVAENLNFVMVWNYGISFGLFNQGDPALSTAVMIITIAIASGLTIWMVMTKSRGLAACLSMVIGGAVGNIIDRFRFGAVIDFLDFHVAEFHWPAFNLADSCIVIGMALVIYDTLSGDQNKRTKKSKKSTPGND